MSDKERLEKIGRLLDGYRCTNDLAKQFRFIESARLLAKMSNAFIENNIENFNETLLKADTLAGVKNNED